MKRFVPDRSAYKLFHDGMLMLSQVEANGIRVNLPYLETVIASTEAKIKDLAVELKKDPIYRMWRRRYGKKASLGSTQQLAKIIFTELGHTQPVRSETSKNAKKDPDRLTADEAAFDDVDLPFIKTYFKMRKLDKALGTYLYGIRREVVEGYIHPNFNLHLVVTYRLSCDSPNFQNIPKRNKEMSEIVRRCYVARPGYQLAELDFSGIEVRVSACYNHDPNLIKYINDKTTDMHRDTAAEIFMLRQDQIDPNDKRGCRDATKNMFVFPQFYGSVYFQCAPNLWHAMHRREFRVAKDGVVSDDCKLVKDHLAKKGITELGDCDPQAVTGRGSFVHHVKEVEKLFWEKGFKGYSEWERSYWNEYQQTGGFYMHTGFTCYGVFKRNDVLDYAIQGSASHCATWSMIQIHRWLRKNKMKTRLIGTIHDSILADVHPAECDDFLAESKKIMTEDLRKHWDWIIVPIAIDAEVSPVDGSFFELEKVKLP